MPNDGCTFVCFACRRRLDREIARNLEEAQRIILYKAVVDKEIRSIDSTALLLPSGEERVVCSPVSCELVLVMGMCGILYFYERVSIMYDIMIRNQIVERIIISSTSSALHIR